MPFDFLRRKKAPAKKATQKAAPEPVRGGRPGGLSIAFEGLTEEWRLVGRMHIDSRLSDALNKREALPISQVTWAPMDGSSGFSPAPGLKSVDPYDLIVVLAGEATKAPPNEAEQAALKVQKMPWDLSLEAPPLRIVGTVYLTPGTEPRQLLERSTEMFLPVVGGIAYLGSRAVSDPKVDTILVNRFYLRGVEENKTLEKARPAEESWPPEPKARPVQQAPPAQKAEPVVQHAPPAQKAAPAVQKAPPVQQAPPEPKASPVQKASPEKASPEPKAPPEDEKPAGPAKREPRKPTHPEKRGWPKET